MTSAMPDAGIVVRKLQSLISLEAEEQQALEALLLQVRELRKDQDIAREGDRPSQCAFILSGLLYRYKFDDMGHRQILGFNTPGDMPDLQSLSLEQLDHSIMAAT